MSGLMHKVKDALSGEKNTPEARAANQGNNGTFFLSQYTASFLTLSLLVSTQNPDSPF